MPKPRREPEGNNSLHIVPHRYPQIIKSLMQKPRAKIQQPLTPKEKELVNANANFIKIGAHFIGKKNNSIDFSMRTEIAEDALMETVRGFDPEKGSFSNRFFNTLEHRIQDYMRQTSLVGRTVFKYHNRAMNFLAINPKTTPEELMQATNCSRTAAKRLILEFGSAQNDNNVWTAANTRIRDPTLKARFEGIKIALSKILTPKEIAIIELYFVDGYTQQQIAKEMLPQRGFKPVVDSRITQILAKSLRKIRENTSIGNRIKEELIEINRLCNRKQRI